MYENGNKHRIRIDLPSFNMPKINKKKNKSKKKKDNKIIYSILPKFGLICLFFFLFIFCISRFGKVVSKQYNENEFNTNLTYIKKEMLDFYGTGNIPQNIGDSSSLSLEELIDQNIIEKSKIENVDNCDLQNSYVTLTKVRDKTYTLKIYVNCDGIVEEKEDTLRNL